jgi:uncharacterized protein
MVKNKEEIKARLIEGRAQIQEYGVSRVGLFGSFVRDEQREDSDVDLLVEFMPDKKTYRNFHGFAEYSEALLGRRVEVLTPKGVSRFLMPYIEKEIEYVQIS